MKRSNKLIQLSKTKIFILKMILFLGQKTFLGRGQIRKVIIDFINLAIEQGVPRYEIFNIFDRDDVSRQSKSDLIKKYHIFQTVTEKKLQMLLAQEH